MLNDFIIYLQRGKKSSLHLLREDLASKNVANLVNVLLKALFYKLWWDDSSLIIVRRLNLCFLIDIWLTWWVLECTTFKYSLLRQFYEIETVFFSGKTFLKTTYHHRTKTTAILTNDKPKKWRQDSRKSRTNCNFWINS